MESLASMLDVVDSTHKKLDSAFVLSLFKEMRRSSSVRRPDVIIKYAEQAIAAASGNEALALYEQIATATLDLGLLDVAENYINKLDALFPNSDRVGRLICMESEAKGDFQGAVDLYDAILLRSPTNLLVRKRKVAIYKAKKDTSGAVTELLNILKCFPGDSGTWLELADLYIANGEYQSAAHCVEEAILVDPHNAHFHTRLAEVYYTIGDYDHYVLARKHYSTSLTMLSPKVNLRALYGLIYACQAVTSDGSITGAEKRDQASSNGVSDGDVNAELLSWAKDQLRECSDSHRSNGILQLAITL